MLCRVPDGAYTGGKLASVGGPTSKRPSTSPKLGGELEGASRVTGTPMAVVPPDRGPPSKGPASGAFKTGALTERAVSERLNCPFDPPDFWGAFTLVRGELSSLMASMARRIDWL